MPARKVQGVEMPNFDYIDSAGDGPDTDLSARSLPYAESKDNQKEAILKVARQIAAANDDEETAGLFFTRVVQAFVLLDQMAPQFIELVDEYHVGELHDLDASCHLCKLRAAAEEYLADREKTNV
jgi:hypothetical protein